MNVEIFGDDVEPRVCGEAELFTESSIDLWNIGTFCQFRVEEAHPAGNT